MVLLCSCQIYLPFTNLYWFCRLNIVIGTRILPKWIKWIVRHSERLVGKQVNRTPIYGPGELERNCLLFRPCSSYFLNYTVRHFKWNSVEIFQSKIFPIDNILFLKWRVSVFIAVLEHDCVCVCVCNVLPFCFCFAIEQFLSIMPIHMAQ